MKRILLSILVLGLLSSCEKDNDVAPKQTVELDYSFLVAGHVYGDPGDFTLGFYPPFEDHIPYIQDYEKMRYAFFTGDVVRSGSNQSHWDEFFEDVETLGIEYHVAAGNHDRGDLFLEHFGQYYYDFREGDNLFIILSPTSWNIEGEQLDYLIHTLDDHQDAKNVFIFCHELIWWSPENIFANIGINWVGHYPGSTNYWEVVDPILSDHPAEIYMFNGDIGATWVADDYAYYNYGNVHFVASGMGHEIDSNYLIVEIDTENKVSLKLKATEGEIDRLGDITEYELP